MTSKPDVRDKETSSEESSKVPYPKGAYFILAGYLLERFVYYGLFGGAVLYMQRVLGFSAASSSSIKAGMEGLIYLAPIAGAILADTYLGKVRTVFTMCCVYIVGASVYTLSSISPIMATLQGTQAAGIGGLFILGIGAGLMKAVYSSLGPDQFKLPEQRSQQQRFFNAFYWCINAGAFLGQQLTGNLRGSVQCFGYDCFFLPYAILTVLMVISTTVFYLGKRYYIEPVPDLTLINSIKCCFYAAKKFFDKERKPVEHWINRAANKYDAVLINDVKVALRVLLLFCTYPLFWALFYQTSNNMIFQAKRLNDYVGNYRIPPELSSTINPLLIITLIPLFEFVIYPILNRLGWLTESTQRMAAGMGFAVISFVVYGILSLQLEQTIVPSDHSRMYLYNTRECQVRLQVNGQGFNLSPMGKAEVPDFVTPKTNALEVLIPISCQNNQLHPVKVDLMPGTETTLYLMPTGGAVALEPSTHYIKHVDAEAKVRVMIDNDISVQDVRLTYGTMNVDFEVRDGVSKSQPVNPQKFHVFAANESKGLAHIKQDGVYDIFIREDGLTLFTMTKPSDIHMLWMFPQFILITVGEVLFSVCGMDFAYTQAPAAMKAVMQAANLFTITVGLWLLSALTEVTTAAKVFLHRPSTEAFAYSVLMLIDTFIFIWLARRFRVSLAKTTALVPPSEKEHSAHYTNEGFQEDAQTKV